MPMGCQIFWLKYGAAFMPMAERKTSPTKLLSAVL